MPSLTRWQQFYREDPGLAAIPPSRCAQHAAAFFAKSGKRLILDLGCGTGRDTRCLASGGANVIGLDAAGSGLALARARRGTPHAGPAFVQGDARRLPFPDRCFEGVYCFGLLHEFVGEAADGDVGGTMAEIRRVLQLSGVAVLAALAGEPEKGLPHLRLFTEAMFDAATGSLRRIEKRLVDDLGCTGKPGYTVWYGQFARA